ncbi:Plasmid recombination enzyme [Xylanibacter ruminicola]|uniref:Plasmid recombination enzyme n=1 Tax=Xylanibacter ruminicola TaxID=839 RepID=A0A1H4DDL8_XYLRU|nr:MobV family relaxase [Xylanibacter ruminicola]SEA70540.1 Plasmid recombination enzyme [Xylanibacter ruminicola]
MEKNQKQAINLLAGKRMAVALSNENLRIGASTAWSAKVAGTLDESRIHLDFEVGKGGVIKEIDRKVSIPKRIKAILQSYNIEDPNKGLSNDILMQKGKGIRTYASLILHGSHDTMTKLAFGNQQISFEPNADNSHLQRQEDIEKWAKDMYKFIADKYGESHIAAFIVHLDETTPHAHCVVVPISKRGKLSYKEVFVGKSKYEYSQRTKELWDEASKISEKYGLARGDDMLMTGARHKSYLQWMREMIVKNGSILEEIDKAISDKNDIIAQQKQQINGFNDEKKKAEKKMKSFITMINNMEAAKETLEAQVAALDCEYDEGNERYEKKQQELSDKIAELEEKLSDKRKMLEDVAEQLEKLGLRMVKVQSEYDDLRREINKEKDVYYEKVQRNINGTLWREVAYNCKQLSPKWNRLVDSLTPTQRELYENVKGISWIEDMSERADEISCVACALYLGFLDQATSFARDNGGGGCSPDSDWGRRKDEDDLEFMHRCCIMGRKMMRPSMSPRRGFRR